MPDHGIFEVAYRLMSIFSIDANLPTEKRRFGWFICMSVAFYPQHGIIPHMMMCALHSVSFALDLAHWIKNWGTLIVTAVLVAVTAWYVTLTKRMASAASESAESSRRASDAARVAASAAEATAAASIAGLNIEYLVSVYRHYAYTPGTTAPPMEFGVELTATGATTFVHSLVLNNAMRPTRPSRRFEKHRTSQTMGLKDVKLKPKGFSLPIQLHAGERIRFELPPDVDDVARHSDVASMDLTVYYSLTLDSPAIPRRIEYGQG